jgi:hypothetical protein
VSSIENSLIKVQLDSQLTTYLVLPESRMDDVEILRELEAASKIGHFNYRDGKISGCPLNTIIQLIIIRVCL